MLHLASQSLSPGTEDAAVKLLLCHVALGVFGVSSPGFPPAQLSLPRARELRAVIKSHLTAAEKAEFPAGNHFFELFAIKTKLT